MSKEDDAIIQAVAKDLWSCKVAGQDTLATVVTGSSAVEMMAENRDEARRMGEYITQRIAKAAAQSVYAALDKAGYAIAQKLPDDAITRNTFPKQGSFLGRRVLVAFDYDKANAVHGTVRREDVEAPGRVIIELDDGRLVLSTECQYSLVKESGTRQ